MMVCRSTLRAPARVRIVVALLAVALVLLFASAAPAVKRGCESVNCGGAPSQSASYKAHDTIAQCPIGPVGEGGGMRIYDGFWLVLPSINVPVEGTIYAVLTEDGTPVVRWSVESLAGIVGFNVYRAVSEDGPYERVDDETLPADASSFLDTNTWPETTFWYEVRAVDAYGAEDAVHGSPVFVTTGGRLAFRLYPLRPNPSPGSSTIRFDLPDHAGPVRLVIHNVRGQVVRTVVDEPVGRGRHERTWDGTDESGRPVASGVYFARLSVENKVDDQKVMVLR